MFLQTLREINGLELAQQRSYQARLLRKVLDHAAHQVACDTDRLALARLSPDPLAIWARIPFLDTAAWSPTHHAAQTTPADVQTNVQGRSHLAQVASDTVFEWGVERAGLVLSQPMIDGTDRPTALTQPTSWNSTIANARRYHLGDPRAEKHHLHLTPAQLTATMAAPVVNCDRVLIETIGLDDATRAAATQHFGTAPLCVWSHPHVGVIGVEDTPGRIRHQLATHVIEITDDQDRPCPIGTEGHIVITSLYDYATPMIRLRLPHTATATDPWTLRPAL